MAKIEFEVSDEIAKMHESMLAGGFTGTPFSGYIGPPRDPKILEEIRQRRLARLEQSFFYCIRYHIRKLIGLF